MEILVCKGIFAAHVLIDGLNVLRDAVGIFERGFGLPRLCPWMKKIKNRSLRAGLNQFAQFSMIENLNIEEELKTKLLLDHDKRMKN